MKLWNNIGIKYRYYLSQNHLFGQCRQSVRTVNTNLNTIIQLWCTGYKDIQHKGICDRIACSVAGDEKMQV